MTEQRLNSETLAAFLEGTLHGDERAQVIRILAESPEAYADFIEAAAVLGELKDADAVRPLAGASLPRPRTKGFTAARRARFLVPSLIAAGLAAIIIGRQIGGDASAESIRLAQSTHLVAAASGGIAASLGDAWNQPPWLLVRGGDVTQTERTRAFRAGVRYAELEVAAQARDSASVASASELLADIAGSMDAGAPLASQFRELASSSDFHEPTGRAEAATQLRGLTRSAEWFDAGVWTETARLAIIANHLQFFAPDGEAVADLKRISGRLDEELKRNPATEPLARALHPMLSGRKWSPADKDSLSSIVEAAIIAGTR